MSVVKFRYVLFLLTIVLMGGLSSCSDDIPYKLNGMWQLKTVEDASGAVLRVDSVYYCFQMEATFAYTVRRNENSSSTYSGYLSFPSEEEVTITIEEKDRNGFLAASDWNDYIETFTVRRVDGSRLVLYSDTRQRIYSFQKF